MLVHASFAPCPVAQLVRMQQRLEPLSHRERGRGEGVCGLSQRACASNALTRRCAPPSPGGRGQPPLVTPMDEAGSSSAAYSYAAKNIKRRP